MDGKLSDATLVNQSKAGDEDAFSVLYDRHKAHVLAYAFKRLGNKDDAEDVVQETFVRAFSKLGTLQQPERFTNWLITIASRLATDVQRERRMWGKYISLNGTPERSELLSSASTTQTRRSEHAENKRRLEEKVLTAIGGLRESERMPYLLQQGGMSYKEIAEELSITENAVRARLARARKKVKAFVLKTMEESDVFAF